MSHGRLKKSHLRRGIDSLEVRCLKNGTLDVELMTGKVLGFVRGEWKEKRLKKDDDGYLGFFLNRERKHKRGKPILEMRNGKERKRWRDRRYVLVNRLVKIKAIAVALGGENWRSFVTALPPGIDVNHIGARDNNAHGMLELQTEAANRRRREMTPEEYEEINQCTF